MKVAVLDITGKDTGRKVELSSEVFGIEPNDHAIYLDVKQYLANQRQGTHKSKERAEIAGSTRKIKKQKGTGTARAGSIKSGVFRGGGRMFGPRPRNYSFKLNKNLKRLARKSALSIQAKENNLVVVEDFNFEAPRTKEFINVLKALELDTKKSLFVLGEESKNVYLSSRNLKGSKVVDASGINTYSVLNANKVIEDIEARGELNKPEMLLKKASVCGLQSRYDEAIELLTNLNKQYPRKPSILKPCGVNLAKYESLLTFVSLVALAFLYSATGVLNLPSAIAVITRTS